MSETKTKKKRTRSKKIKSEIIDKPEEVKDEIVKESPVIKGETKLTLSDVISPGGAGPAFVDGKETEDKFIEAVEPVEKINMQNTEPIKFLQGKISPRPVPSKKNVILRISDLPTRRK
jgi:hypothetical protein